jgi:hypothetical protein
MWAVNNKTDRNEIMRSIRKITESGGSKKTDNTIRDTRMIDFAFLDLSDGKNILASSVAPTHEIIIPNKAAPYFPDIKRTMTRNENITPVSVRCLKA